MLRRTVLVCALLAVTAAASALAASSPSSVPSPSASAIQSHTVVPHAKWALHPAAPAPDSLASLSFVLAKQNVDKLEAKFHAVSDPKHAEYGHHLSRDEVRAMVQPDAAVVAQWHAWAESQTASAGSFRWNDERDILHLRLPVAQMEALLGHELRSYTHPEGGNTLRASVSSLQLLGRAPGASPALLNAIPAGLEPSISYLAGVSRFPLQYEILGGTKGAQQQVKPVASKPKTKAAASKTLAALRAEVAAGGAAWKAKSAAPAAPTAVPSPAVGDVSLPVQPAGEADALMNARVVGDSNSIVLILFPACATPMNNTGFTLPTADTGFTCGFGAPYVSTGVMLSKGGVVQLNNNYGTDVAPLITVCTGACASTNPTLAVLVQIRVPLPANYVQYELTITYNWGSNFPAASFQYPFPVVGTTRVHPLTVSQFYGVPDQLVTNVSASTVAAVRMSIGALVLGSSQSQGMYSTADLGAFLNANRIDPYNAQSMIRYVDGSDPYYPLDERNPDVETMLDISETMGVCAYTGLSVLHVGGTHTPFEDLLNLALRDSTISVLSLSYGIWEQNMADSLSASNTLFMQLGAAGVSVFASSGDNGAFFPVEPGCTQVAPSYPATSPYLTAVGGTTLGSNPDGLSCPTEVVSSVEFGAIITSGGGFSSIAQQLQQPWQTDAINAWYTSAQCPKPDASQYTLGGRAYPDISMLAHNYEIVSGGQAQAVDGTSASSPILAGIIAMYNQARVDMGLPKLGFLNPLLYQTAKATPAAFNDIVTGDNSCMSLGMACCDNIGFDACEGWDAASGLGSPNFRVLGPILAPNLTRSLDVSNYFFPTCAGYATWPAGPASWPAHPGPDPDNKPSMALWIIIVIVAAAVLLGVISFACIKCSRKTTVHASLNDDLGQRLAYPTEQQAYPGPIVYANQQQGAPYNRMG